MKTLKDFNKDSHVVDFMKFLETQLVGLDTDGSERKFPSKIYEINKQIKHLGITLSWGSYANAWKIEMECEFQIRNTSGLSFYFKRKRVRKENGSYRHRYEYVFNCFTEEALNRSYYDYTFNSYIKTMKELVESIKLKEKNKKEAKRYIESIGTDTYSMKSADKKFFEKIRDGKIDLDKLFEAFKTYQGY